MLDRQRYIGGPHGGNGPVALAGAYDDPRLLIQDYAYEPPQQEGGIDVLRLFLYVIHYRWLLATLVAVGLVSALAITMMMTPRYRATAQLEVLMPSAKVFQDIEVMAQSSDMRAFLTAREKLSSRSLAQRVVFALGLSERADFLFPNASFSPVNLLSRAFGISGSGDDLADYTPEQRARMAVDRLLKNLTVDLIPNTSLLSITYSDQKPKYAYEIANQVAQSYIDQRVDQASDTSSQARKFIQEQVVQVKERLQKSEEALVAYAKKAGITITGTDNSLIAANLTEINKALAEAIQENLDYGRLVQQIDNGQGASLERVLKSEALDKLREKSAILNAEYQQKLTLFKPDFPEMKQLHSQIEEIDQQLALGVKAITDSVRLKYRETKAKVTDLKAKLAELEAEQSAYQDKNIQYTILKREVDSNRSQYDSLISKLNEVDVGSELRNQNAQVADLAVMPRFPYSPKLTLNVAIGLILSMALGAAIIYVLELLNNTFANPEQVEKELGLSILGIVPAVDDMEFFRAINDPKSNLSEAYRSLRTSLQFSGEQGAPRTLLITSSEPSEGKSTTVYKLAEDFAGLGAKVLVIDADLRKPSVHRVFKVDNAVGLSNVLTSTINKNDLPKLIKQAKPNVSVITAGMIPPNPADLLSSTRMGLLLQKLAKTYDIVLIDSAPIIGLSDAPILSRLAEATLVVVSFNQVTRKAARAALKRIRASGANVVGAAFTKFSVGKLDYNYSYRYLNYHYYNYGDEAPKIEGKVGDGVGDKASEGVAAEAGAGAERRSRTRIREQAEAKDQARTGEVARGEVAGQADRQGPTGEIAPEHAKNWSFAAVSHRMRRHLRDLGDRIKSAT